MKRRTIAALCYQQTDKGLKYLLITSSTGRWIIPKGQPEENCSNRQTALNEAWEEGGVTGEVTESSFGMDIRRKGRTYWKIYPVRIDSLSDDWPEKALRERRLVSPEKFDRYIDNADLLKALRKLAKKLVEV